jgi:hypothetical protein
MTLRHSFINNFPICVAKFQDNDSANFIETPKTTFLDVVNQSDFEASGIDTINDSSRPSKKRNKLILRNKGNTPYRVVPFFSKYKVSYRVKKNNGSIWELINVNF